MHLVMQGVEGQMIADQVSARVGIRGSQADAVYALLAEPRLIVCALMQAGRCLVGLPACLPCPVAGQEQALPAFLQALAHLLSTL